MVNDRYDYYLLLNALSAEPGFMWCLRPTCNFGQIFTVARAQCDKCGFLMCRSCHMPWHQGRSCNEYSDYASSHMCEEKVTKPCPGCQVEIQKDGGCNEVKCEVALRLRLI